MAGSLNGMRYETLLLGGWDLTTTATANALILDTELAQAERLGAFKKMLTYPACRAAIFADNLACAIIARSSAALGVVLTYYPDEVLASSAFYAALNAQVNDANSFLLRTTYTSGSGTWTAHANGLTAHYEFLQAPGGNGSVGQSLNNGGGGGGGESKGILYPENSLPAAGSTKSYSVGAVGANTSLGASSVAFGANGVNNSTTPAAGGGSTSTSNASDMLYSSTPASDPFQIGSFTKAGGAGGASANGSVADPAAAGTAGVKGSGGAGGTTASKSGKAGTGLGSGGGAGCDNTSNGGAAAGQSATANTGCGGGGGSDQSGAASNGGTGLIVVYSVKKRAA